MEIELLTPHVFYLFLQVVGCQDISASKFCIIPFTFQTRYTWAPLKTPVFIVLRKKLLTSYRNRHFLRYAASHWLHHSSPCLISPRLISTGNSIVEIWNGRKSNIDTTDENNFKSGKFWALNRTYVTGIIDTQMLKLNTAAELLTWQIYNKV